MQRLALRGPFRRLRAAPLLATAALGALEGEGAQEMVADFVAFIRSLIAAGVRQIHMLAHSMGELVLGLGQGCGRYERGGE